MSTTNAIQKKSTDTIPAAAALIGIDNDGAKHYVTSPIHDDVTIYVQEADGDVETWQLSETPYDRIGGPNADGRGWFDHVDAKRGWDILPGEITAAALDRIAEGL
jgi:hypothetical protein